MAIGRRASAFASTAVLQVRAGSGRALSTSAAARQRTYRDTIPNLALGPSSRVLLLNATGRASTLHAKLSLSLGTNIVGGTSSKSTHPDAELAQKFPLFPDVRTAVRELGGVDAAAVFVPPSAAADAVLECIEEEIPTVVAVAEGIPTRDQMRVMAALHSQSKSRYLGANSPGYTNPRGARLGIAPVAAASPGCIGIAARSGTLSYEAMGATKDLGLGQSYCLGLGGDAYPGTRTDEALEFLLNDPTTKGIIIVGEVGGTMEEDVSTYLDSLPSPPSKPIVGFIAGLGVPEGRSYGHSGAIYHDGSAHSALQKRKRWMASGVRVTGTIGETAMAIKEEMDRLGIEYP